MEYPWRPVDMAKVFG